MINHPNRKQKTASGVGNASARKAAPRAKPVADNDHDHDYSALLSGTRDFFNRTVGRHSRIFTTDADGLWGAYLESLPAGRLRQIHNCHCCRRFIETYGGLVAIDESGNTTPVMWSAGMPPFYDQAFRKMHGIVAGAKVNGVFLTEAKTWGNPQTGDWQHLAVVPPTELLHRDRALDPNQAMAAVRENVKTVSTALSEYGANVLDEALRLLAADVLTRSEKFVGPVQWLRQLHNRPKGARGNAMLWRAVALAPEGYCHIKSSVLGPLLDDIVAGVSFDDIKRKHAAKLNPLQYQRPQAAPSEGNVRAAEALVEKLGLAPALPRRFARLDELPLAEAIWSPPEVRRDRSERGGVFGHLKTKQDRSTSVPPVNLPSMTMTWDKFERTVLPTAERLELMVPSNGTFNALTTAVNAAAPPLLKWDRDEERNRFAWYTYPRGSSATQWKMTAHRFASVNAVFPFPNMWGSRPQPHLHVGALLILEGCADTRTGQGNALFPECLRDDLHGARATIEAYSRSTELEGRSEASACGISIGKTNVNQRLRVFDGRGWTGYLIDRWD